MSLNILKKVYSEAELENRIHVDGEWKVEIVSENGEVAKPLGDKWRKNLIQNKGLNILNGSFTTANTYDPAGGVIGNFLRSAFFGPSNIDPFSVTRTFLSSNNADIFWTKRLTANVPENTTPRVDDLATGSITYRRVWDFQALASGETKTVQEIVISSSNTNGFNTSDQARGTQGTFNTGTAIISRFILPEAVTLTQFQFLRLYYQIKITVPAIVTPVNINLQNNGFDATGRLKLLGSFYRIFEDTTYRQTKACQFCGVGTSSVYPWTPWSVIGRDGCSAVFLKGNSNSALNYSFPNVNTDVFIGHGANLIYDTDSIATVTNNTAGGSMNPAPGNVAEITPVNNTLTREASLLFPANNPSSNGPIAGIWLFPFNGISFGYQAETTTWCGDGCAQIGGKGWYWQFTDETYSAKRSVTKDLSYGLAINIRQVMARG